jgi:hypothetical protein
MIKAKPIRPEQYWILRDRGHKVGNIELDHGAYVVSIRGSSQRFNDLREITRAADIDFEPTITAHKPMDPCQVHGYPTSGVAYNAVFDVQHQLPLWTTEPRSRAWLAAGWYRIQQHQNWRVTMCPKLIILERYPYRGPFMTREEAQGT